MKIGIRQLRENLSEYLKQARAGATVVVTERGEPVARLVPPVGDLPVQRLIQAGVVLPPKRRKRRAADIKRVRPKGEISTLVRDQRR